MYDTRQWPFVADMNHSGAVTISDVWLWVEWLFFYPGDKLIHYLVNEQPWIAQFLEITYGDYGGPLSFMASMLAWGCVVFLISIVSMIIWALLGELDKESKL